jgi:uncharacterized membrane protein YeaQ/YmgE (transglycosylase-associated protein family)
VLGLVGSLIQRILFKAWFRVAVFWSRLFVFEVIAARVLDSADAFGEPGAK